MSVSKSYAAALYAAAQSEKLGATELDQVQESLQFFAAQIQQNASLRSVLCGPTATLSEKSGVVQALVSQMRLPGLVGKFLSLLIKKGRIALLSDMADAFARVRTEASGGVLGLLESTDPLSSDDVHQLSSAFSKKLGKPVVFTQKTCPELLAGLKVTVAGTTYDGSLKAQLLRLRDQFLEGSSSTH
jgi:F-type H+-transporting ATPase subunit delta